ncbi:Fe-only nitrogenase accessory protein AnfO [Clostridium sp.]|jgi:Fe-only nitrogenase accessory protein AnfO|uniref:Fe-only nitrogenase accessory protein AnfO n=1 Tax=Clostridium sp. TaxID=1506 RepID=UPI002FDD6B4D
MNKEIAVLENYNGEIASFLEPGTVKLYTKQDKDWKIKDEIIFSIYKITDVNLIRERIIKMVESLGQCKIFVGKKIGGIPYSILERFGVNSWEITGKPDEFLDHVMEKEEDEERKLLESSPKCQDKCVCEPIKIGQEGHYFLDLIKVQQQNPNITTKQILVPFFKNQTFSELTINCSHVPKWFENELDNFGLKADVQIEEKNRFKVTVKYKTY